MCPSDRLACHFAELTGQESRALASISRDFDKAATWMEENQQSVSSRAEAGSARRQAQTYLSLSCARNIANNWPPERTAKALKDLDERLTKGVHSHLLVHCLW